MSGANTKPFSLAGGGGDVKERSDETEGAQPNSRGEAAPIDLAPLGHFPAPREKMNRVPSARGHR